MITPCISVCKIDIHTSTCQGCGRTMEEIRMWSKYSDEERMGVMKRLGYGKEKIRNLNRD